MVMSLEEAIRHCCEVSDSCSNHGCADDHKQLAEWLTELAFYRKRYGNIEKSHPSITLTKTNLVTEIIHISEITRIETKEGVYENTHYHSRVWFGDDFHYYVETVEEIANLISHALNK